jgi:cyd operon protein YbgT
MWYFAWALGVSLAASFAILNAMWLELDHDRAARAGDSSAGPPSERS